ncbi:hypothetical protein [Halothiobacillus neapolitanus]|uniref:YMGG-like Gly-zipper domain-containing protein n=1 Tax=Halothiobacillus neapolitanus (strain ATCC 23641 / DSM 15147 / CIP 104769 / NCIMB 8539 / c2) TaxID=555778 RepID=D0L188_HALNC|nr:hypothetical protein [Halothiobacillus neapolitanus]ACX96461.1 hypothetical protein Hneap_1635 [Halothiobacillus neapolitanus c2]TDN66778.1 hypothetical protein C8D83_1011117 [Halothiobacillus neapolitanus]
MNKNAVMTGLLMVVLSPTAHASFFGHIAEHAAGYAAGAIAAHEGERVINDYQRQHEQNQSIGQGGGANADGIQADGRYAAVARASQATPNPKLTPGAINTAVTQQNLDVTICRRGGYTKSIRPKEAYT